MKLSPPARVTAGLGSNLDNRLAALRRAVKMIGDEAGEVVARSSVWESEPWGFDADEQFLNMVIIVETRLSPARLMKLFSSIEGRMGRRRSGSGQYESRIIDIDILLWEGKIISLPGLEVPHPRLADRRFVLEPLAEVAPDAIHPVMELTVAELLEQCPDNSDVRVSAEQF